MQVGFQENSYSVEATSLAYFDSAINPIPNCHFFLGLGKFQGMGSFCVSPDCLKNADFSHLITKDIYVLKEKITWVEKFSFTDPFRFWHYLHHLFPHNPWLVTALDMAGWTLFSEMERRNLSTLWKNYATEVAKEPIQIFDQSKWASIPKKTDRLTGIFIDKVDITTNLAEDNDLENIDFFVLPKDIAVRTLNMVNQPYPKPFFLEIDNDTQPQTIENIDLIEGVYITPYELGGISPCLLAIENWKKKCPHKKIFLGTGVSDDLGKNILENLQSVAPCFLGE